MKLSCNVRGRANNMPVPATKPLLPIFEAVVNSLQAIADAMPQRPSIDVIIEREQVLSASPADPISFGNIDSVSVVDNGIGFTPVNMQSFLVADTEYRANIGGKGIGRFTWLKAFESVEIESHYRDGDQMSKIVFVFNDQDENPPDPVPSTEKQPRTVVTLRKMKEPYRSNCPKSLDVIARRLVEHFLPSFLGKACPHFTLADGQDTVPLNDFFRETYGQAINRHEIAVGEEKFALQSLRLYGSKEKHRLIYAANSREVRFDKLGDYVVNLNRPIDDKGKQFVYLGFLEGRYLDLNVTPERAGFLFPDLKSDTMEGMLSLEHIREKAIQTIEQELQPFIAELNEAKRTRAAEFINENPQYRPLLQTIDEVLNDIPPSASDQKLDAVLHKKIYEKQKQVKEESLQLLQREKFASLTPKEYSSKLAEIVGRANMFGKSSLAEYVAHRKIMIEFFEKSLEYREGAKEYPLEDVIHRIIYPMRATSDEVAYTDQNLWMIDERLTYHVFLASDKPLKSFIKTDSQLRPDIMVVNDEWENIFDGVLAFGEDSHNVGSIVLIEFKKPGLNQLPDKDPVKQVQDLIEKIQTGQFTNSKGIRLAATPNTPAYAYIIADLTTAIIKLEKQYGMTRTPDGQGFYRHNPSLNAYIEVISYQKMLADAKKRNQVFFERLFSTGISLSTTAS